MDEAESLADQVVVVDHGRVIAEGPVRDLLRSHDDRTLRFSAEPGLDVAGLAGALASGTVPVDGPHAVHEVGPGDYVVSGHVDPQVLAALTAWCAARGVLPHSITVGRRTLESVFLDLTGRDLR
jgi:ABC-2 type transport system ATP-binding protein